MLVNRLIIGLWLISWSTLLLGQVDSNGVVQIDIAEAYKKGVALMNANQYAEAYKYMFECQRSDRKNVDYQNRLAYCYFQMGNYSEAKYVYKAALKLDSLNISAISNLAAIAERERNYNQASDYYGQLIGIDSTNAYYYRQNALIAQRRGDLLVATAFFNKAHSLNEQDIATISDLATAYLELKAVDYAEQIITKGMNLDSSNIRVLQTNARIRNALDDYDGVIRSVGSAMQLGDSTNYYAMMIGVAYLKKDSLDQCIYHLDRVVAREKASEHTHHYLALAYELKGDTDKAREHFDLALEKGISKKVPLYHKDLAELYEKDNKYYKAYENYRAAYSYDPDEELLFHIAHNADRYYKDKTIALRYYQRYLKTGNNKYRQYAEQRIPTLKELIHQMKN